MSGRDHRFEIERRRGAAMLIVAVVILSVVLVQRLVVLRGAEEERTSAEERLRRIEAAAARFPSTTSEQAIDSSGFEAAVHEAVRAVGGDPDHQLKSISGERDEKRVVLRDLGAGAPLAILSMLHVHAPGWRVTGLALTETSLELTCRPRRPGSGS